MRLLEACDVNAVLFEGFGELDPLGGKTPPSTLAWRIQSPCSEGGSLDRDGVAALRPVECHW